MEKLYYYLEDVDGGLIVDQYYMDNHFDPELQTVIMQGTAQQIDDYMEWLCNTDII